jgi:predicted dehydrogenase
MNQLRVGIVGLGSMAQRHVDAVKKSGDMELAAVCHHKEERLKSCAAQWGVQKTYLKYADMIADKDIDAVIIVTPNHLHANMTIAALQAGKHVFCEKPPAMNADEAKAVMDCAKKSGKLVMYGFMFRFSQKHNFVKELREKGLFGDIYYTKAGIIRRCGNPGGWFANKALSGGGPLIDTGSHIVDLAIYLMGDFEPVSVFARTFKNTENLDSISGHDSYKALNSDMIQNDVEEFDLVVVNFNNGACLVVETSFMSHIKEDSMYLQMQGTKGGITVDPELEIYTVQHGYLMDMLPKVSCNSFDYQQSIDMEIQNFADSIMKGAACRAPVEAGYKLMKIISAAYQSAAEQKLILI